MKKQADNGAGAALDERKSGTGQTPALNVSYDRFLDCVHCGLCLSYCPTYAITGVEADSPRGRVHLLRAVADGRLAFDAGVKKHIDLCLGCLACETACPSGIQYHQIIEAGRELSRSKDRSGLARRAMEQAIYNPDVLEKAVLPLRWANGLGLGAAVRSVARRLPAGLGEMLELLPELPPAHLRKSIPSVVPAVGEARERVGFVTGCVMSVFFSPTHLATLRVLASNGCEVRIPAGQGCCGALAVHSGDRETGRALAKKLIDSFLDLDVSAIVVNSAGCGSTMKEYERLLEDDEKYRDRAKKLSSLVCDVSELLYRLPIRFPEPSGDAAAGAPLRVTYHDACHLAHGQKVRQEPRELLRAMPGIELVELVEADWCCGSAGTYNLTQPEMAGELLKRKVSHLLETGADVVVTGNPGCSLQIARGLREAGSPMKVMHTMDLLAMAYPDPVPGLPSAEARGHRRASAGKEKPNG